MLHINCSLISDIPSSTTSKRVSIDWSNASPSQITNYQDMVSLRLSVLSDEVLCSSHPDCSIHHSMLDSYAVQVMNTLLVCALQCVPSRLPYPRRVVGWNYLQGN